MITFFVRPLFFKGYCFICPQNSALSEYMNNKIYIIEKSKKIISEKTVSHFSIKPQYIYKTIGSRHNSMT